MEIGRLIVDWLHLVFAAVWVGSVIQYVRLIGTPGEMHQLWPSHAAGLRLASNLLLIAATFMVCTGLFKLKLILGTDAGVFRSLYGQVLLAKIVLALGMFAVAAWNHLVSFAGLQRAAANQQWQDVAASARASARWFKINSAGSLLLLLLVAILKQL